MFYRTTLIDPDNIVAGVLLESLRRYSYGACFGGSSAAGNGGMNGVAKKSGGKRKRILKMAGSSADRTIYLFTFTFTIKPKLPRGPIR